MRGHAQRTAADLEAEALAALSGHPGMTGRELAAAIGASERTARRIRVRLTESQPDSTSSAAPVTAGHGPPLTRAHTPVRTP